MREIYLDHAATTYLDPMVLEAMLPYFQEEYGNPESLHQKGQNARVALDQARSTIAQLLNCQSNEIIFTSGGTESNNLAILGIAQASKGKHIIISAIEHSSIFEPCKFLEKNGYEITILPTDKEGFINLEELKNAIRPDTILVSIIYANNEIGTIQDIKKIGEICRANKVPFHTDACQATGVENINVEELNIDLMTLNASKIYGPKGVGALYINQSVNIKTIQFGGGQENNLRSGTHNTTGIIGLAKALELSQKNRNQENQRLTKLRDQLIDNILKLVPHSQLNGPRQNRLANNINLSFQGVRGEELLLHLDNLGIYISTGSACQARSAKSSSVLKALGLKRDLIDSTIRISLGKKNTDSDIDYLIEILPDLISKLRKRG